MPSQPQDQGDSPVTLLVKFAVVLGLLFVCLRVLRAVMPRKGGGGGSPESLILHREPIGDKQAIQLLDLGSHVVLVGVTGTTITPLLTTNDADEMATLRARYLKQQIKPEALPRQSSDGRSSFAGALAGAMAATAAAGNQAKRQEPATLLESAGTVASEPRTAQVSASAAYAGATSGIQATVDAMRSLRRKLEQQ